MALTATSTSKPNFFPILTCILIWAWNTPMYVYLKHCDCDPYTMSFYRTVTAALAVTVWELVVSGPRAMNDAAKKESWRYLLLAFLFIGGMFAGVAGAFYTSATLAILLSRATPLVALSLSAIMYADERKLIRRPDFILGFALALAGLIGLSLVRIVPAPAIPNGEGGNAPPDLYAFGVVLLLVCALLWGSYSAVVKGMVHGARPFTITSLTFWVAAIMAFPVMLFKGDASWIVQGDPLAIAVLVGSGLLMGLAEGFFYLSVHRIGLAPSTSATLLVPFLTALIAWQFLDEKITVALVGFGVLLLSGLGVIVWARSRHLALIAGGAAIEQEVVAGRAGISPLTIGQQVKVSSAPSAPPPSGKK